MKNFKISLLAAGVTIALLACSSLEVSNPEAENFPSDWNTSEFVRVNPDLRALQIRDQVAIMNAKSGKPSDLESFMSDSATLKKIALEHAGFTEANFDFKMNDNYTAYLQSFNINGVDSEYVVFDTLTLDSAVFEMQYIAYGKIEGRPYRMCGEGDLAKLVKKGECQASESAKVGYSNHKYCALDGVTYCFDCDKVLDECPVIIPESSSSEAAPESSETVTEGDSSSSEAVEGDSSSSEVAEPESSEGESTEPESSSATEPAAESSSSVTE